MACVVKRKGGHKWVQFYDWDGRRKTVRLGKCDRRTAEQFKSRIETLLSAKIAGVSFGEDSAKWLTSLKSPMYAKLAKSGLVEPRKADETPKPKGVTVGELTEKYISKRRTDDNRNTVLTWEKAARDLVEFFGTKPITEITAGHAEDFVRHLEQKPSRHAGKKYSTATVSKRVQISRQFFRDAIKWELITRSNPFGEIKTGSQSNESRKVYVPAADVEKLIESATGTQWKLLLALCRYVGVRCPSEVVNLTWDRILWDRHLAVIYSPKLRNNEKKRERIVPLRPEVMPHLERRFSEAAEGETHVLPMVASQTKNLRTQLQRIAERAGVKTWPKLFHNLRASAQTDFVTLNVSKLHTACLWAGNSQPVAAKHYLGATPEDFARITGLPPGTYEASK